MKWEDQEITKVEVLSKFGNLCRINAGGKVRVTLDGKSVRLKSDSDGSVAFETSAGGVYTLLK